MQTITNLRAFVGITNYYTSYVQEHAKLAARLHDKLEVRRHEGTKWPKKKIGWGPEDITVFAEV